MKKNNKTAIAPDGIIVINEKKKVIVFNEAAQRITGFKENEIISQDYDFLFKSSDKDQKYVFDAITKGTSFSNISMNISCGDRKALRILSSITPIKQPQIGIIGAIIVFRNMQEMLSLTQELQKKNREILDERNKLVAIFNSRLEGTFTIDKDWTITSFNRSAERITGYSSEEAIGKKCWEIFNSNLCQHGCHMRRTMKEQQPSISSELLIIHKEGQKVPVRVNSAPLFDGDGYHIGAVETFQDISEIKNLINHLENHFQFKNIIGRSKSMQKVYDLMENVIQSDGNVLITGESGTGKEIVARAIHLNSERKTSPFMAVNCSAFVESLLESELFGHEKGAFTGAIRTKPGRLELAKDGTLFLDEIGDLSLQVQVKLLRVLESREFERVGGTNPIQLKARLVTATNKNLDEEMKAGRFREDLYYRINVINIHLPPLKERLTDLPFLVQHFVEKYQNKFNKNIKNVTPAAYRLLKKYEWPGNIRELENVIEHAFTVCHEEAIQTEHLPERLWASLQNIIADVEQTETEQPLKNAEKLLIKSTLEKLNGHRDKTAKALDIDKSTLWRKMKKYGLQ
jgi:sigma-54 dependent transcriptional regulator, acetoin dehydrogenase operon transcriptional activator AcoR